MSISVAGSLAPGFLACVVPSRRQLWIAWLWNAWAYIPLVCRRRARAGLDGFASSCIQSPTVDASIQDLVRCSLTGSPGKRRRLDPTSRAWRRSSATSPRRACAFPLLPHLNHPTKLSISFARPRLAIHFRPTPVRNVRVSVWVYFGRWESPHFCSCSLMCCAHVCVQWCVI